MTGLPHVIRMGLKCYSMYPYSQWPLEVLQPYCLLDFRIVFGFLACRTMRKKKKKKKEKRCFKPLIYGNLFLHPLKTNSEFWESLSISNWIISICNWLWIVYKRRKWKKKRKRKNTRRMWRRTVRQRKFQQLVWNHKLSLNCFIV